MYQVFIGLFFSISSLAMPDYLKDIQPIFNMRCVQCHSCYNSPCQLNLSSAEGLSRGLIQGHKIYDSKRLRKLSLSRLGTDYSTIEQWREFGFRSVLEQRSQIMSRVLEQKRKQPLLPVNDLKDHSLRAENSRVCPDTASELNEHLVKRPEAGMPYGLPALENQKDKILSDWIRGGARVKAEKVRVENPTLKKKVEKFLNRFASEANTEEAKKRNLVSRYLYEHLFLAHLRLGGEQFFKLVRSRFQCDHKIEEIPTRRPWEATGEKYYYCLKPIVSAIVHKTHIVYEMSSQKIKRWERLFFAKNWRVNFQISDRSARSQRGWKSDKAPRGDSDANNPFLIFKDIPVQSRYQFLLDDAEYFVRTFIRGPVCKGNTAVNSIDEQFYVFFLKPESDLMVKNSAFENKSVDLLHMPAKRGSEQTGFVRTLIFGRKLRKERNQYRELRDKTYGQYFSRGYSVKDLWKGNSNAALTVMRHFDSASVAKGLVGAVPKTIFVLDYSIFERFVYNLVVGFDVYGDINHQVHTRIYMSYLRMEAEENFLAFLPAESRRPMRHFWYTEGESRTENVADVINHLLRRDKDKIERRYPLHGKKRATQMRYSSFDVDRFYQANEKGQYETLRGLRTEFVDQVKRHMGRTIVDTGDFNTPKRLSETTIGMKIGRISSYRDFERQLNRVTDVRAINAPWVTKLPGLSYVIVGSKIYTFVRNKEHFNVAWISGESGRRNFASDSLIVYKGVTGSYANHIFNVPLSKAQSFLQAMIGVKDEASYLAWTKKYGSPRSGVGSERFWPNSDRLHQLFKRLDPVQYGIIDYNRYGVDYRFNKDGNLPDSFFSELPDGLREGAENLAGGN